jgi:hypothetical protein
MGVELWLELGQSCLKMYSLPGPLLEATLKDRETYQHRVRFEGYSCIRLHCLYVSLPLRIASCVSSHSASQRLVGHQCSQHCHSKVRKSRKIVPSGNMLISSALSEL